ncbi:MAG: hypothetical protein DMG49_03425 [Acidobacteria bacterium]|nr:MAG: hypothetical protein DMG49_03425 [Acidobacteriota bacterium]
MLRPYKEKGEERSATRSHGQNKPNGRSRRGPAGTGRALALAAARPCGGKLGFAALLFGDGLRVDQPLAGARTAGLPALDSGEAPDTDEAADFGAGGIQYGGNRLRGEGIYGSL